MGIMEVREIDFAEIPQKTLKILTKPVNFFKTMPKAGGFLEPVIFVLVVSIVTGILHCLINIAGLSYIDRGILESLGLIIFVPVAMIIASFIGAAIMFVIWKLLGSQENYETSYRCVAYLTVLAPIAAILGIIPYGGTVLNALIGLFFIVTRQAFTCITYRQRKHGWFSESFLRCLPLCKSERNTRSATSRLLPKK